MDGNEPSVRDSQDEPYYIDYTLLGDLIIPDSPDFQPRRNPEPEALNDELTTPRILSPVEYLQNTEPRVMDNHLELIDQMLENGFEHILEELEKRGSQGRNVAGIASCSSATSEDNVPRIKLEEGNAQEYQPESILGTPMLDSFMFSHPILNQPYCLPNSTYTIPQEQVVPGVTPQIAKEQKSQVTGTTSFLTVNDTMMTECNPMEASEPPLQQMCKALLSETRLVEERLLSTANAKSCSSDKYNENGWQVWDLEERSREEIMNRYFGKRVETINEDPIEATPVNESIPASFTDNKEAEASKRIEENVMKLIDLKVIKIEPHMTLNDSMMTESNPMEAREPPLQQMCKALLSEPRFVEERMLSTANAKSCSSDKYNENSWHVCDLGERSSEELMNRYFVERLETINEDPIEATPVNESIPASFNDNKEAEASKRIEENVMKLIDSKEIKIEPHMTENEIKKEQKINESPTTSSEENKNGEITDSCPINAQYVPGLFGTPSSHGSRSRFYESPNSDTEDKSEVILSQIETVNCLSKATQTAPVNKNERESKQTQTYLEDFFIKANPLKEGKEQPEEGNSSERREENESPSTNENLEEKRNENGQSSLSLETADIAEENGISFSCLVSLIERKMFLLKLKDEEDKAGDLISSNSADIGNKKNSNTECIKLQKQSFKNNCLDVQKNKRVLKNDIKSSNMKTEEKVNTENKFFINENQNVCTSRKEDDEDIAKSRNLEVPESRVTHSVVLVTENKFLMPTNTENNSSNKSCAELENTNKQRPKNMNHSLEKGAVKGKCPTKQILVKKRKILIVDRESVSIKRAKEESIKTAKLEMLKRLQIKKNIPEIKEGIRILRSFGKQIPPNEEINTETKEDNKQKVNDDNHFGKRTKQKIKRESINDEEKKICRTSCKLNCDISKKKLVREKAIKSKKLRRAVENISDHSDINWTITTRSQIRINNDRKHILPEKGKGREIHEGSSSVKNHGDDDRSKGGIERRVSRSKGRKDEGSNIPKRRSPRISRSPDRLIYFRKGGGY